MKMRLTWLMAAMMALFVCCVQAQEPATHAHTACGKAGCTDSVHDAADHMQAEYVPYTAGMTLADGMNVYLQEDMTISQTLTVPAGATVRLCLNGHTLAKREYGDAVSAAGTLILCDCSDGETGTITHALDYGDSKYDGSGVRVSGALNMYGGRISGNDNMRQHGGGLYISSGTVTLYGGSVEQNSNTYANGGGAYMSGGSLTLRGGTIARNRAGQGGGVYMTGGSLIVYSGSIVENISDSYGGGVHMSNAVLEMHGGEISRNEAKERGGGGIDVGSGGSLTLYAGSICDNKAAWDGGGVYLGSGGVMTMHDGRIDGNAGHSGGIYAFGSLTICGGSISGNSANREGGGIWAKQLTMTGGEILGNSAQWRGGGVHVSGVSSISGGRIAGNTTPKEGGGINVGSGGSLTLGGCAIEDNTAAYRGGGMHVESGSATLESAVITDNSAQDGGGVYISSGSLTMTGGRIGGNMAVRCDGGGVCAYGGITTLKGGEITGNRSARNGGGVYVNDGITLGGSVRVSGNASSAAPVNNLYLGYGALITLSAPLTGGAGSVGVSTVSSPYSNQPLDYMVPATGYVLTQSDLSAAASEEEYVSRIGSDGIAEFVLADRITISAVARPASGGTVRIETDTGTSLGNPAQVEPEDMVYLRASTASGAAFMGWYQGNTRCSTEERYWIFNQRKNMTYTALFRPAGTLVLPLALTEIGEEAFAGANMQAVEIAHGCAKIGARAFANCRDLAWIRIPASVTDIAENAFEGCGDAAIIAPENSAAQAYAFEHGLTWLELR